MSKRRSLDDALTPSQEAFLEPDVPRAHKRQVTGENKRSSQSPSKESVHGDQPLPQQLGSTTHASKPSLGGLVSLNARIDPAISQALMRAMFERRMSKVVPFTQQDIVSVALMTWLRENGFMT